MAKAPAKAAPRQTTKAAPKPKVPKRTSQGLKHRPKGKNKRKNWKQYRGQGH